MRKTPHLWKHADVAIDEIASKLAASGYLPKKSSRELLSKRLSRDKKLVFALEPIELVDGVGLNPTLLYVDSELTALKSLGDIRVEKKDCARLPFIGNNIGTIVEGVQYRPEVSSTINRALMTKRLLKLFAQAEAIILNCVTQEGLARLAEDESLLSRIAVKLPLSTLQIRVAILLTIGNSANRVGALLSEFEQRHFEDLGHANKEAFKAFRKEALLVAGTSANPID